MDPPVTDKNHESARDLFDQGVSYFHKYEYGQAAPCFEEAVLLEPDFSEALYNLACCYAMTGRTDKALIYLNRAIQLNPFCVDWAKEDPEFQPLNEHPLFQRIVTGLGIAALDNLPEGLDSPAENVPDSVEAFPKEDPAPAPESDTPPDEPPAAPPVPTASTPSTGELPPCARCQGLLLSEPRSPYNRMLGLGMVAAGMLMWFGLLISCIGILGFPLILAGLYSLSRTRETWTCQNCGATGALCGQPPDSRR